MFTNIIKIFVFICSLFVITLSANANVRAGSRTKFSSQLKESIFLQHNYFKIKGGIVQPTALDGNTGLGTGDPVYTAGFAVGSKFYEMLSVDIEYMYRAENTVQYYVPGQEGDPTSWSYKSDTIMLNFAMDVMTDSRVTPYARVGAGLSMNKPGEYILNEITGEVSETKIYPGLNTRDFSCKLDLGLILMPIQCYQRK